MLKSRRMGEAQGNLRSRWRNAAGTLDQFFLQMDPESNPEIEAKATVEFNVSTCSVLRDVSDRIY